MGRSLLVLASLADDAVGPAALVGVRDAAREGPRPAGRGDARKTRVASGGWQRRGSSSPVLVSADRAGVWRPRTLVDRFPLCRIYIRNVNGSLKTHRAQFPQAALFPDAVVIALDVIEYRGPDLVGIQPQMLVDELFLDRGIK